MDEKLDELLGGCPGYPLDLSAAEQQVWHNAQRAMLEVGYRKPQQPASKIKKNKSKTTIETMIEGDDVPHHWTPESVDKAQTKSYGYNNPHQR